jgi:penicillin-binding protein A
MKKSYNYKYKQTFKSIKEIIEKRYSILIGFIILLTSVLLMGAFYLQVVKKDIFVDKINLLNKNIIEGDTAPRGKIYDRNNVLIVDNKPNKIISYKKIKGITAIEEASLALLVSDMIDIDYSKVSERQLKNYFVINNNELLKKRITSDEWKKLEERKLSLDDIEILKRDRITEIELNSINKEAAYIYYLMNVGYSYSEKVIKKDNISDLEYAVISENMQKLKGFSTRLDWNREYLYGSVFRNVLGSVSSTEMGLPYELKDYYLDKGYSLNDRVGISSLEYQYEDYLRGVKDKFEILDDQSMLLYEKGKRGNDIVLTIDIKLQQEVEKILEDYLKIAKTKPNTEYYNRSFVIISDPMTGEILAMAGKQIVKEDKDWVIYDYTPGIYSTSVAPGSLVKGASQIVGYNNNALTIGEKRDDECVKIASTPKKCSYRYMGVIDDIKALKYSSNTYQFYTAIKVGNGVYKYDKPLSIDTSAFDKYRKVFSEFGLGVKTNIDLPNENLGYKGTSTLSGHLLDFSIGQYDTYTPIQLAQYMNTVANGGKRMQPYLLKEVYNEGSLLYKQDPIILGEVNTKPEFMERVQLGFEEVYKAGGTGYGVISTSLKPAGKTGTSESFIDTDGDGKIDTETFTNTLGAYAPYDNPKASFTVISPDISHPNGNISYTYPVNRLITSEVVKKFFEIYK